MQTNHTTKERQKHACCVSRQRDTTQQLSHCLFPSRSLEALLASASNSSFVPIAVALIRRKHKHFFNPCRLVVI